MYRALWNFGTVAIVPLIITLQICSMIIIDVINRKIYEYNNSEILNGGEWKYTIYIHAICLILGFEIML